MSDSRRRQPVAIGLLDYGFRPFFLFGALWAAASLLVWLLTLTVGTTLPSHLTPLDWHVHGLLYGYLPAAIAGFLLTAIPNWTGRLPVRGWPLAGLFGLWLAGRLALSLSALIPAGIAIALDLAFLAVLGLVALREIVAGSNWRNLKVLVPLGLLLLGNGLFHRDALDGAAAGGLGTRLGIAAVLILVMLVGGRIVPSFTRNWLAARGSARLPVPFGRFDLAAMLVAALALAAWLAAPGHAATAWLCLIAGGAHLIRLARWQGHQTGAEPLVWVLHLGYLFVPLGFLLVALAILAPTVLTPSAALHGWTTGAFGMMTLAVMSRATLGHTGQALTATPAITALYVALLVAVLARLAYGVEPGLRWLLDLSATAWMLAFLGFALRFGPLLCRPRRRPAKTDQPA